TVRCWTDNCPRTAAHTQSLHEKSHLFQWNGWQMRLGTAIALGTAQDYSPTCRRDPHEIRKPDAALPVPRLPGGLRPDLRCHVDGGTAVRRRAAGRDQPPRR